MWNLYKEIEENSDISLEISYLANRYSQFGIDRLTDALCFGVADKIDKKRRI